MIATLATAWLLLGGGTMPAAPPDLTAGHKALPFVAKDIHGKRIRFPASFKGKVVLLDFWATWCGPCMGEVPNVAGVYRKWHSKGFAILGISLDNEETIGGMRGVMKRNGMTWDQIADGKFWDAAVAKKYGIESIPHAFLIDGDTGKIFAEGDDIRGYNLEPAVKRALAAKHRAHR